mmetsp:Transcript_21689/g.68002  ORF Transcript_21689/g.68002 Transcript_21689/m.68002 type:complete len:98 (+) Transcript_21689:178-471(+)
MLAEFGYDEARGFPARVDVAPRAVRTPVPAGDPCHDIEAGHLVLNLGEEVRGADSPYGRYMTTFRKSLRDPVVSDAGVALNMHEVEAARRRHEKAGR